MAGGWTYLDNLIQSGLSTKGVTAPIGTPAYLAQLQPLIADSYANAVAAESSLGNTWSGQHVDPDWRNPEFNPTRNDNGYTRFDSRAYGAGLERAPTYAAAVPLWESYAVLKPGESGYDNYQRFVSNLSKYGGVDDWRTATDKQLFDAMDATFRQSQYQNTKENGFFDSSLGGILGSALTVGAGLLNPGLGAAVGAGIGAAKGGGIGDILLGGIQGYGGIPIPGQNGGTIPVFGLPDFGGSNKNSTTPQKPINDKEPVSIPLSIPLPLSFPTGPAQSGGPVGDQQPEQTVIPIIPGVPGVPPIQQQAQQPTSGGIPEITDRNISASGLIPIQGGYQRMPIPGPPLPMRYFDYGTNPFMRFV